MQKKSNTEDRVTTSEPAAAAVAFEPDIYAVDPNPNTIAEIPDCKECSMSCEFGKVIGDDGCPLCQCKPKPACKECSMSCEFGKVMGDDGCPLCKCKPNPDCNECKMYCEFGKVMADDGCPLCQCKPKPDDSESGIENPLVEEVVDFEEEFQSGCKECSMSCEFGKVMGNDGCPLCQCKPNPAAAAVAFEPDIYAVDPNPNTIAEIPDCKECSMSCEFGKVIGDDGCPLCQCKPKPDDSESGIENPLVEEVVDFEEEFQSGCKECSMSCEFGKVMGNDGCPLCQCKPNPDDSESGIENPLVEEVVDFEEEFQSVCKECKMSCEFGKVMGDDGCPLCKCKPKPVCKECSMSCEFGKVMGDDGCPLCKCKPKPAVVSPKTVLRILLFEISSILSASITSAQTLDQVEDDVPDSEAGDDDDDFDGDDDMIDGDGDIIDEDDDLEEDFVKQA
ncbi:uncharacterized protein LOC141907732 [Tubulanus polymorphus]|uniref:uncharacterized protein LOC141907732 n=1 Tax=Tubulanus polymorphus TaxID=672921 RepID=UPI003DA2B8C1